MAVASVAMGEALGWTQSRKGVVLSAFFVGYIVSLIPSGWLAMRFGGRRMLPIAVFAWSLCTLVMPFAALDSFAALLAARICLGLAEGALFPSCYDLLGEWIPAAARTRAISVMMSGIPVGQVGGLAAAGWIIERHPWPTVFYVFGAAGFLWLCAWIWATAGVGRDNAPPSHSGEAGPRQSIPWRRLLTRRPIWAVFIALFCGNWGLYFLLSWLPSYFRGAQGLSIANAGLFSAAPWVSAFVMSNAGAYLADAAIARGVSVTRVRKVVLCAGFLGSAGCLLLARDAHSAAGALACLCGATGALSVAWSAYAANYLDLAPRHASFITSIGNTLGTIPGIVGVVVTGWLIDTTGTYASAFALTAALCVIGAVVYCAFGSGRQLE
jgi:ACS family sodium-dependent inorganic phosphate cotransporter